jgi:cytochrome c-type biogenesis protein CcmF
VWLFVGAFGEWTERIGLFRRSMADALRKAAHLPRSAYGMTISHLGLAIALIGIVGSVAWKAEYLEVMRPGDSATVAGYQIKFVGAENNVQGPNYVATRGTFVVTKNDRFISELHPERRFFDNPQQSVSNVAIHTNLGGDIYAVLGDPSNGGFIVHIYHNPIVPWLFFGTIMMVIGGGVSLTDRRHRIGAPLRKIASRLRSPGIGNVPPGAAVPAE